MIEQPSPDARSMSRRQALKRGAVVGGALVWTVPAVQAITMSSAHAEAASAPPGPANGARPEPPAVGRDGTPPAPRAGGLSGGAPVIATAAVGTGVLVGGAAVTAALKAQAAAGAVSSIGGGTGSAAGGAVESVIIPPPPA
jgi:hypothetical protein